MPANRKVTPETPEGFLSSHNHFQPLSVQEPCHQLAWTLDACINDKKLGARRLDTLRSVLQPFDRPTGSAGGASQ